MIVDPRARRLFDTGPTGPGDLAASPFRADRDRIVGSPFFARLGGVTQVISPGGSGLLVHNRLTHVDVLFLAHHLRVERGDHHIDREHLADAIEQLVAETRDTLSDDRSPKDPYS